MGRRSDSYSSFVVVEDTPRRLVLRAPGWNALSVVLLAFSTFWGGGWLATRGTVPLVLAGGFLALVLLPLSRRRRFIFDAESGTVSFDGLFTRGWQRRLSDIEDVQTDFHIVETTVIRGAIRQPRSATVYRAFLVVDGKRFLVNESESKDLISDIRDRILAMRRR